MKDIVDLLQEALIENDFETAADAVDFVLKETNVYIDFNTFVRLTRLAQTQIEHKCSIKYFV